MSPCLKREQGSKGLIYVESWGKGKPEGEDVKGKSLELGRKERERNRKAGGWDKGILPG